VTTIKLNNMDLSTTTEVSDDVLAKAPQRLSKFVSAMRVSSVRSQLREHGWSSARVAHAATLLQQLAELGVPSAAASAAGADPVRDAYARCAAFMTTDFVAARAVLTLDHPEQATFLFHDLDAGDAATNVLSVSSLLERVAALRSGAGRKGTRKADHDALVVMAEVGVTKEVLDELSGVVKTALQLEGGLTGEEQAAARVDQEVARSTLLRQIHAFYVAWSTLARALLKGRGDHVALGIAKRRAKLAKPVAIPDPVATPVSPPDPVVTPAPIVTPAPVAQPAPVVAPVAMPITPITNEEAHGPSSRAA
jgi:hypothetical protein